jgi:hypothetical protein
MLRKPHFLGLQTFGRPLLDGHFGVCCYEIRTTWGKPKLWVGRYARVVGEAPRDGKGSNIMDEISVGRCPCGASITVSIEECAVTHSLPQCREFKALDPPDFLIYVRRFQQRSPLYRVTPLASRVARLVRNSWALIRRRKEATW